MKLVSDSKIQELKDQKAESNAYLLEHQPMNPTLLGPVEVDKKARQEEFLVCFSRSLSVSFACKKTEIPQSTYYRWRNGDPDFAEALNEVMALARDELKTSAMTRAMGYVRLDDKTGETEVDADGRVLRYGASDALAKSILGLDKPDTEGEGSGITVTLDKSALLGLNRPPVLVGPPEPITPTDD